MNAIDTSREAAVARSVADISTLTGLSYRKIAERFGIPYRTMENWSGGKSKPPEYVLLMMQEILGLYEREH